MPSTASSVVRATVAAAEKTGAIDLGFEADELMRCAMSRTGLADWGDPIFRDGLDRLLHSARDDAHLHALGRLTLRTAILRALETRLGHTAACAAHPAALTKPVRNPIVIAAAPRTGSTLLHRLLAAHPDAASLPQWKALQPFPSPPLPQRPTPDRGRWRRAVAMSRWLDRLMPALKIRHEHGPGLPVECSWLMLPSFESAQWWTTWPVHTYGTWVRHHDAVGGYRDMRSSLQLLQHGLGNSGWALKAPQHFPHLPQLLDAIPEATVVLIHRDPAELISSASSLMAVTHGTWTSQPDMPRSTRTLVEIMAKGAHAAARRVDHPAIVHVAYEELARSPLAVVRRLARHAGWRDDDQVRSAWRAQLDCMPPSKFGTHRHDLRGTGMTAAEIRAAFDPYVDTFAIPTGAG